MTDGNQDNLWIGSYSGGLAFLSFSEKNTFKSFNAKTDQLSFPVVSSFAEQGNFLWIGTEGGGLNRYDQQTGGFTSYIHQKTGNSLSFDHINSLLVIGHQLWISLPRGGLDCLDTKIGLFTHYSASKPGNSIANEHIHKLVADGDSGIWISYLEGATDLTHYSIFNKRFKHYKLGAGITDFCTGSGDTLWIASTQLYAVNARSETLASYKPDMQDQKWGSMNILTIHRNEKNGDIWIGTNGHGLIKYSVATGQYSQEVDLSKFEVHSIYSIRLDDNDYVWFGTDNGLFRLNPSNRQLLQFNKADGTQGKIYYKNAAYKSKSGWMYFGGNEGFTIVDPALVSDNVYQPDVIISELLVNSEPTTLTKLNSPLRTPIYKTEKITFNHNQNNFGFEFASTNYLNPEKNRFRYRLKGYDNNWIETDALHRIASYSKVPAGKYTFEIITANNDGVWGKQKNIDITVLPAPWVSIWAILCYIALGIGIIFIVFRYYNERRKLKMRLYLEEKEYEQKEEYHQEQLRFFTNVSHDFRTPLSLIMAAFETVESEIRETKYKDIINNNVKRLHSLVNELLDFRALQNGKMELRSGLNNWNRFIEKYCADFFEYARQKDIDFMDHFDETIPEELFFDPKVLEKIALNLLHNAFKYTSPGGKITVRTLADASLFHSIYEHSSVVGTLPDATNTTSRQVSLIVSDTGIGISEASISKVFERYYRVEDVTGEQHIGSGIGLALVKSLVELHGGTITIYSERNKGTDMVVTFYLKGSNDAFSRYMQNEVNRTEVGMPIQKQPDDRKESEENVLYWSPGIKKMILLVEDNNELRGLIAEMLSESYEVVEAKNGAVALELLEDENPDLILTDVMMPLVDGIALCRSVKENMETSHIPVVMLTAKSGVDNHIESIEMGADLYLEKPINKKLLLISLANLFKQQERIKEYYSKNFFADSGDIKLGKRDSEFMEALQNEIEKQISNPNLDIGQLASSLAISRSKLYSKTKALTGKSVVEFIRGYRLRKIAKLLIEEDLPINIIIEQAGIDNPSYFSRIFKKEFGMTPSEFIGKQRNQKGEKED